MTSTPSRSRLLNKAIRQLRRAKRCLQAGELNQAEKTVMSTLALLRSRCGSARSRRKKTNCGCTRR